jgi:glycosyltransferase 2 family protein
MEMLDALSRLTRTLDWRIGWNGISAAISLVMIAIAAAVFYGILRDVDLDKVIGAIGATSPLVVLAACACVVAGYLALTFYDYFALRAIGRREIPYATAALASFTSYAIGHNLGATLFTGGAVRLRIYSAWGLGIIEVAKIAFISGLTFWLGNIFVLGLALTCASHAAIFVTHMPVWANRGFGIVGLAAIVGYIAWLLPRPRAIGISNWRVVLPKASLSIVQIGIGAFDFAAGAVTFYLLLPAVPVGDFPTVAMAFVVAILLGFLSHAPGSLGVFDLAIIVALPQYEREHLLATLLIFRALYFVLPLVVAVLLLAVRELWLIRRTRSHRFAGEQHAVSRVAPSRRILASK